MINKIVQVTVSNSAVGNLKYYRVDCRYEMNGKIRKYERVYGNEEEESYEDRLSLMMTLII